jgi:hypothetical protein
MIKKYSEEYIAKRLKWYHECHSFIELAEYQKATAQAKLGFKLFPDDTIAAFTYFSILADYALSKKSKKFKLMHKTAVKGMKKLLGKTSGRGISQNYKKTMKNEYYYQTKQFKKQYELGINFTKRHKNKFAMYSAGVGAANYALELAKTNQMTRAKVWARKSIKAWEVYFEVDKKYYNPYVHLALAYGILGEEKKMERSLRTAARLSGKSAEYGEFEEVRGEVSRLLL